MELTQAQIDGLKELWCRPHKTTAGSREVDEELEQIGLKFHSPSAKFHPLTLKGKQACLDLCKTGWSA